jgi:hypothetical protein
MADGGSSNGNGLTSTPKKGHTAKSTHATPKSTGKRGRKAKDVSESQSANDDEDASVSPSKKAKSAAKDKDKVKIKKEAVAEFGSNYADSEATTMRLGNGEV